jgi:IS5 family transposase
LEIQNTQKEKDRKAAYRDLLEIACQVRGYALEAIPQLYGFESSEAGDVIYARNLAQALERALSIFDRVIDQTRRRVLLGQKVAARDKIVSFFECHTDIIEKGRRRTTYGHKVFFCGGPSGLILGCRIERGNPADSERFKVLLEGQKSLFGRMPRQVSADGGFTSRANLAWAKGEGVRDVCFSKRRGFSVLEMVRSHWVFKKLRNFRAGIEANISRLKRAFGLSRCNRSGWAGFRQYVWSAGVAYNLSVLARHQVAAA